MAAGFIHDKLEIKFLILYIAARVSEPLPPEGMQELTMCDDGIDYFAYAECLNDLVQTEHLRLTEEGCYAITPKGLKNSEICESSLPYSVRLRTDKNVAEYNRRLLRRNQVQSQVIPRENGSYVVELRLRDDVDSILHLELTAATEAMARDLAEPLHIPAYVYDPVAVDEMPPMARITGIPELPRRMMGHALNTRAMAIRCAETVLHKPFDQCRLIVLHLGGGASVRLFIGGKMVDNVRDDELLFAPERSGGIAAEQLVKLCYSGKYDRGQMMKLVRGKSGLLAHLGTSDAMEVERRIAAGDEKARMVYDAMLYTAAKSIGALAAAADGRIDRIILTGGIAHSRYVTDYLTQKVGFIAPVEVMAGEFEMEALAAGASRVLAGQETPHRFRDLLKGE